MKEGEDFIWVGHDMAIWSNNAYEEYMPFFKDKDKKIVLLENEQLSFNNFDYLYGETIKRYEPFYFSKTYSGKEYYFFSKRAIVSQIEVLEQLREEVLKIRLLQVST